jgi:adenosylcobinamide kinase/adenosylcobinamide-phosphate guanylyltransferase
MAELSLVLGGVRSGKSRFAEQLAASHPRVVYLATAQAGDPEMVQRIAAHRRRRPAEWQTIEEPWDVVQAVFGQATAGCVLVECLPLWLTNLLVGLSASPGRSDADILAAVADLVGASRAISGRVIVVSNEVGCGLLPANSLSRRFGDLLGEANQYLAAVAVEVFGCVAGIGLRIK